MEIYNTWFSIAEKQPPSDTPLVVRMDYPQGGKEYRMAMLFSPMKHEADSDWICNDNNYLTYDEEHDIYYCPAGWYEKAASHEDVGWWRMSEPEFIKYWMIPRAGE